MVLGATCCSGANSSSKVILGSAKSVFRLGYSNMSVIADSNENNQLLLRNNNEIESFRSINTSYSRFINNFWQWGINIPMISKSRYQIDNWKSREQLGDISLTIGYKILPEYKRNFLFSKAHIFATYTYPNAPSLYTTKRYDLMDVVGSGHDSIAVGIAGFKRNTFGVSSMQFQYGHRLANKFNSSQNIFKRKIKTNASNNFSINLSHAKDITENYTFSIGTNFSYIENSITKNNLSSTVTTTSFSIGKTFDSVDLSLSYSDDFIFNYSHNHFLSKSISIGMISRFN